MNGKFFDRWIPRKDYKLPEPTGKLLEEKREVAREKNYDTEAMAELVNLNVSKFNQEQLAIWEALKNAIANQTGDLFGLQASGTYCFTSKTILL